LKRLLIITLLCVLVLVTASWAEQLPVPTPAKPDAVAIPAKVPTPAEMLKNCEANQVQIQQAAQQLQADYEKRMKDFQTQYDQLEGAKQLLLTLHPELKKAPPKPDAATKPKTADK
jgi:hypothetical protein